jgi:hypothetical protein
MYKRVHCSRAVIRCANGFKPAGEPVVAAGRQNGVVHRTVVVTDYRGVAAGLMGTLAFGVGAKGEEAWIYASVLDSGVVCVAGGCAYITPCYDNGFCP